MVVLDVEVVDHLHLQRVQVGIEGEQVEGEIPDFHILGEVRALNEFFGGEGPFGPEHWVELTAAPLSVDEDEVLELAQVLDGGRNEDDDLVEVDVDGDNFEGRDSTLLGDFMLVEDFLLDDEVHGHSDSRLQHQQLAPGDLWINIWVRSRGGR